MTIYDKTLPKKLDREHSVLLLLRFGCDWTCLWPNRFKTGPTKGILGHYVAFYPLIWTTKLLKEFNTP